MGVYWFSPEVLGRSVSSTLALLFTSPLIIATPVSAGSLAIVILEFAVPDLEILSLFDCRYLPLLRKSESPADNLLIPDDKLQGEPEEQVEPLPDGEA